MAILRNWLAHPLTRGLDIDDPRVTHLRRRIIQDKSFLRQVYREWYAVVAAALPSGVGPVLELGSGAGFLSEYIPGLITTEVFPCAGITSVLDGHQLPLADGALRALVLIDVLHHLPHSRRFLAEAARCVRSGGRVIMIEPWVSRWSRIVYTRLHHEPFRPDAAEWEFPPNGPLSGANGALPWMIFVRDRTRFAREFPTWAIETIRPMMPFRYLVSGGVSLRGLMPGWTFGMWSWIEERGLKRWMDRWAMFALIVLSKVSEGWQR